MTLYECIVCGEIREVDHSELRITPMHCGEVCAAILQE